MSGFIIKKKATDGTMVEMPIVATYDENKNRIVDQYATKQALSNLENEQESFENNIDSTIANAPAVTELQNNKVDKIEGKQLSTNDYTTTEKNKLSGIANNANNYTHPSSHPPSIITQDANNRFVTDTEKTAWNNKINSTDPRLSDARTPTQHAHSATEITSGTISASRLPAKIEGASKLWASSSGHQDSYYIENVWSGDRWMLRANQYQVGVAYAESAPTPLATQTSIGGIKVVSDGTTLHIRTDGEDPTIIE